MYACNYALHERMTQSSTINIALLYDTGLCTAHIEVNSFCVALSMKNFISLTLQLQESHFFFTLPFIILTGLSLLVKCFVMQALQDLLVTLW